MDDPPKPDANTVAEALRQGEQRLSAQLQFQIELDRRISTLTGVSAAGATAVLVLSATLSNRPVVPEALVAGVLGVAACLFFAAICFGRTLRVIDFYALGNRPLDLDYFLLKSEVELKSWALEGIQGRLDFNERQSAKMRRWIDAGFYLLIASPVIGVSLAVADHYHFLDFLHWPVICT